MRANLLTTSLRILTWFCVILLPVLSLLPARGIGPDLMAASLILDDQTQSSRRCVVVRHCRTWL
jgi:hypothetical protein